MSYTVQEESIEDGQPIELYRFSNSEETFTFTNGPDSVIFNSETYEPIPISRTDPDLEQVQSRRNLIVKTPIDNPVALRYVATIPATPDEFSLFRQHSTDGGTPETITFFSGRVTNVAFAGIEAQINIQNFGVILERLCPQQTTRNPCNHILYDSKCAVDDSQFRITGTVTAISADGLTITLSTGSNTVPDTALELSAQITADADFFNAGFVRRGGLEHRMVRTTTDLGGNVAEFTILFPFQTIGTGTALDLFAGCDHQFPTCIGKFANTEKYGGFPFVPLKNPFEIGVN